MYGSAGEKAPLSKSGNLLTRNSIEYFNPVKHAMALSNTAVLAAKLFDKCGESCHPLVKNADWRCRSGVCPGGRQRMKH